MANPLQLNVNGLPSIAAEDAAATASPARGAEMTNFLRSRLNQKNRAPPLVHSWDFWHDRQDRSASTPGSTPAAASTSSSTAAGTPAADSSATPPRSYEDRLEHLASINDVREFWSVFNNFEVSRLALRDSVHLFHRGVKPLWEDARNARGGSWTFRVPRAHAAAVWQEVGLLAIGEALQAAVEDPARATFRDDICGVSLSVRFTSVLVQVWNRDGDHRAGIDRVAAAVLDHISPELRPKEGSYYYKKHSEHAGFATGAKEGNAVVAGGQAGA